MAITKEAVVHAQGEARATGIERRLAALEAARRRQNVAGGASVSGSGNATQIQGVGVSAAAPTSGQVLKYDGTVWKPQAESGGMTNPMTTQGDLIVGGAAGAAQRLGAGTSGYVLTSGGPGVLPSYQPGGTPGSSGWTPTAPAAPTSTGTAGQYSADGTHGYLCYAANSWGRFAIAPAFENPPVADGLVLYYDANMYGFATGSSVGSIIDLAGNGHHADAQSTGATFQTNQLNGRAALSFPGTSVGKYILENGFSAPNITVFAVASVAGSPSGTVSGDVGSFRLVFRPSGSGVVGNIQSANVTDIGYSTTVIPLNTFVQMNVTLSGVGAWAFRTNRAASGSGTSGGAMPSASSNLFGWSSIGGGTDFFSGKIAEFIVYNRVLTPTEIASVEAFLFAKYGV